MFSKKFELEIAGQEITYIPQSLTDLIMVGSGIIPADRISMLRTSPLRSLDKYDVVEGSYIVQTRPNLMRNDQYVIGYANEKESILVQDIIDNLTCLGVLVKEAGRIFTFPKLKIPCNEWHKFRTDTKEAEAIKAQANWLGFDKVYYSNCESRVFENETIKPLYNLDSFSDTRIFDEAAIMERLDRTGVALTLLERNFASPREIYKKGEEHLDGYFALPFHSMTAVEILEVSILDFRNRYVPNFRGAKLIESCF